MRPLTLHAFVILLFLALLPAACILPSVAIPIENSPVPSATLTRIPISTPTFTPTHTATTEPSVTETYPCPQATQEVPPRVAPLQSPTNELKTVVEVSTGNLGSASVITESGTFSSSPENPGLIEVTLLPNTIHHLVVIVTVRVVEHNGCTYGGYDMQTSVDVNELPLVIVQGQPPAGRASSQVISSSNIDRLQSLAALQVEAARGFFFNGDSEIISYNNLAFIRWKLGKWQQNTEVTIKDPADLYITCAALSPNGKMFAVGTGAADNRVRLVNSVDGSVTVLGAHEGSVEKVVFNPNGNLLASGDGYSNLYIWDVNSGTRLQAFKGDNTNLLEVFNNLHWLDNSTLLALTSDKVYKWDAVAGYLMDEYAPLPPGLIVVDAAFTLDGSLIVAAAQSVQLYLWDTGSNAWTTLPSRAGVSLSRVAFSPDENLLAALSYDGDFFIWETSSNKLLFDHKFTQNVISFNFSPNGEYIAFLGWQNTEIEMWGIP